MSAPAISSPKVISSQTEYASLEFYEKEIISKIGEETFRKFQTDNPRIPINVVAHQMASQYSDKVEKMKPFLQAMNEAWRPTQILVLFKQLSQVEGLLEESDKQSVEKMITQIEQLFLQDLKEYYEYMIEEKK